MARRIPPCAWCGKPLARAPERVLHEYLALPGRPAIGWHLDCAERDPDYQRARRAREEGRHPVGAQPVTRPDLLMAVERRGLARVVAGTAYWRPA